MSVNGSDESASLDMDFLDMEPTREAKAQMRKATKRPSEWLRLLCRDWASENDALVDNCDDRFMEYKPYLKGMLTSQLLCRLSIPVPSRDPMADHHNHHSNNSGGGSHHGDFWRTLGIVDEFDKVRQAIKLLALCWNTSNLLFLFIHCFSSLKLPLLHVHNSTTVLHCGPN